MSEPAVSSGIATGHFKTTEELHTIRPIPATGSMPAGWSIRMPVDGQHITVTMFGIEPGVKGAYRVNLSRQLLSNEWELAALRALEDMVSFVVTDWDPITETLLENIAAEFHVVCSTGTIAPYVLGLRGAFPTEVDESLMRWVTVRRG